MNRSLVLVALDWAIRSFGASYIYDLPTRSLRVTEEAVELAQSYGIPEAKMHDLVSIVYSRPRGFPLQEIGGVLMTINILCEAIGRDTEELFCEELRRVLSKSEEHFRKRNEDKIALGLKA